MTKINLFCSCCLLGRPFLPRRGAIYCSIACSKGEPMTPTEGSDPGWKPNRPLCKPLNKLVLDNESTVSPPSLTTTTHTPTSPNVHIESQHTDSSPDNESRFVQSYGTLDEPTADEKHCGQSIKHQPPSFYPPHQIGIPSPYDCKQEQESNEHEYGINIYERPTGMPSLYAEESQEKEIVAPPPPPPPSSANTTKLYHLLNQDRCRDALDLTDVGVNLPQWQTQKHNNPILPSANLRSMEPTTTSSMPEITILNDIPHHQSKRSDESHTLNCRLPEIMKFDDAGPSTMDKLKVHKKPVKGVRFEGIQDTLIRSKSYEEGRNRRTRRSKQRRDLSHQPNRDSTKVSSRERRRQRREFSRRHQEEIRDPDPDPDDNSSVCSTCSSSSLSNDEYVYQLPQRRHYGGVRVSYIPNDVLANARRKQSEDDKDNKNCIIS